jgi:hypothetical protein
VQNHSPSFLETNFRAQTNRPAFALRQLRALEAGERLCQCAGICVIGGGRNVIRLRECG